MKRRTTTLGANTLLWLACLLGTAAPAVEAQSQEGRTAAGKSEPSAGTTRKLDDYGKIGHCDETARLDNFAITLQNEPDAKGYLLVYTGRNDKPAWREGILNRAADYLVNSRGIDAGRLKVVDAGYREQRTTELWVVAEHDPPPGPTDTIEFTLDRTKAYQWDEMGFDVAFTPDPEPEEPAGAEGEEVAQEAESAEAVGEAVAGGAAAEAATEEAGVEGAAGEAADAESAAEAEWRKAVEKYEIAVYERGVYEDETAEESEADRTVRAEPADAGEPTGSGEGAEADTAPPDGEVKVSLWWNVEKLADELKAAPDSSVCIVYYYGEKNASREKVKEMVERALVKTEEQLGVRRESIITVDGGRSRDPGVEIWVVPPGAAPPKPRPERKRDFGFYSAPGED